MIGPIDNMYLHEKHFTRSERIILHYVENHLDVIASNSILDVADKINVSKSALLRFCKKCGYSGYSEFKYDISRFLLSGRKSEGSNDQNMQQLLDAYTENIQNLLSTTSQQQLLELASYILKANRIKTFGLHETGLSARYLEFRLMNLGYDCQSIPDPSYMTEKASICREGDLNIFISVSGVTDCIVEAIHSSHESGAKTIMISSNPNNAIKDKLDMLVLFPLIGNNEYDNYVDSQAIVFVVCEMIISMVAKLLKENNY